MRGRFLWGNWKRWRGLLVGALASSLLLVGGLLAGAAGAQESRPSLVDPALGDANPLQDPRSVTTWFPRDREQRPDWVDMLRRGLIQPRETLRGAARPADPLGSAPTAPIIYRNTKQMPYVVFPHAPHAEWLTCGNCHDSLFPRKATGVGKGMMAIFAGEYCGACHGRVAFSPIGSCYRCHSMPNPDGVIPLVAEMPAPAPAPVADEEEGGGRSGRRRGGIKLPGGFAPVR